MFFCKSWFRAKKRPIEEWSEERARVAHERGELYTVLVGSTAEPWCFLEVTGQFVGVSFLDQRLREALSYDFQEVEPGLLFLTMATYRDFDDASDQVARGTSNIFTRDGSVSVRREPSTHTLSAHRQQPWM